MTPPSVSGRSTWPSGNRGGVIRLCRSSGLVWGVVRLARCSGLICGVLRLDRGSGLLWGVVRGVRLCRPSGLAAGVGMGVVEAEACLVRGSGLGVRAVRARSRAASARASGEDGSVGRRTHHNKDFQSFSSFEAQLKRQHENGTYHCRVCGVCIVKCSQGYWKLHTLMM